MQDQKCRKPARDRSKLSPKPNRNEQLIESTLTIQSEKSSKDIYATAEIPNAPTDARCSGYSESPSAQCPAAPDGPGFVSMRQGVQTLEIGFHARRSFWRVLASSGVGAGDLFRDKIS